MENLKRRVRILDAYAVLSLLVFGVLAFGGSAQTKQRFDELDFLDQNGKVTYTLPGPQK